MDDPVKGLTYKIEVGANRYDLLCIEGISRALNIYLGNSKLPRYTKLPASHAEQFKLLVKPRTSQVCYISLKPFLFVK